MPIKNLSDEELQCALAQAFQSALDLPADADVTGLAFGVHRNWDSLGHMTLVVAIEGAFDIALDEDEVLKIDSYAAAVETLRSHAAVSG